MTWPVPSGNRNGPAPLRELSNCLPLLSFAAASYSQPVYCTTAIFPEVIASPVPGLISEDCIELTPPVGAVLGLPLQAVIKAARRTTPICRRYLVDDAMAAILKDFTVAVVRCGGRSPEFSTRRRGQARSPRSRS